MPAAKLSNEERMKVLDLRQAITRYNDTIASLKRDVGRDSQRPGEDRVDRSYLLDQVPDLEQKRSKAQAALDKLLSKMEEPEPTPEILPVSEAEQRLADARRRLSQSSEELAALASEIDDLGDAHHQAVLAQAKNAGDLFRQLKTARERRSELSETLAILRSELPNLEAAVERAKGARSERERQHWAWVASQLPLGSKERWCAQIKSDSRPGRSVPWDDRNGARPVGHARVAINQQLDEQFPFTDPMEASDEA